MKLSNGFSPGPFDPWRFLGRWGRRAAWAAAIWTAVTLMWSAVGFVYARAVAGVVRPIVKEETAQAVAPFERRMDERFAQAGVVNDAAHSLLMQHISHLEQITADGVYTKREIDAMRRESYRRQDSLFFFLLRHRR